MQAIFRALGGTGSVVVPAYNCIAVPEAVEAAGWRPVFADVATGDINMNCESVAASVDSQTRAVVLTHQFGIPPDVSDVVGFCRQRGLFVVEDAAAALGARHQGRLAGTFGDAAVLSFHFTKILNAGRGGALLTNNGELAERVAGLCSHPGGLLDGLTDFLAALAWWAATKPGSYAVLRRMWASLRQAQLYEVVAPRPRPQANGFRPCSRFVAGLVASQLKRLDVNLGKRKRLAATYAEALTELPGVATCPVGPAADPCWMQYPVFVERKQECYQYMLRHGVDLSWTFRYSCGASYKASGKDNAERAARTSLGLPTYPGLRSRDARRIALLLRQFSQQIA